MSFAKLKAKLTGNAASKDKEKDRRVDEGPTSVYGYSYWF